MENNLCIQTFVVRRQQVFATSLELEWIFHIHIKEHQKPAKDIHSQVSLTFQKGHPKWCKKEEDTQCKQVISHFSPLGSPYCIKWITLDCNYKPSGEILHLFYII